MFEVFKLTDDGYHESLGYYHELDDAEQVMDDWSDRRPNAYIDIREVEN